MVPLPVRWFWHSPDTLGQGWWRLAPVVGERFSKGGAESLGPHDFNESKYAEEA